MLQSNIWKASPIHHVCHILHSICYLLYSVMALLKSIFINIYIYKKKNTWQFFFSLELLKAISLKYLKSLMVRFFFSSYKIKIPFEFSDVQKEIEMNHMITESVCYSEYSRHHFSMRKSVFKIQGHITRIIPELFGK